VDEFMKDLEYWQTFVPFRCDWNTLVGDGDHAALYFAQMDQSFVRRMYEAAAWSCGLKPPHEEFDLVTSDRFPTGLLASPPPKLRQLEFFVRVSRAHRVLEVGTFIGVSTLYLARALPPGGEVVTLEKFDHFAALARQNFARNGLADRIRLIEGDAMETLPRLPDAEPFDLIYLDGDKARYREYFDRLEPRLSRDGLLVIDDVFFHGDALDEEPRTDKGAGVRALLAEVARRDDLFRCLLPIGAAGMLLVMRR
jgi:predicted O-methyltransferase YrrM